LLGSLAHQLRPLQLPKSRRVFRRPKTERHPRVIKIQNPHRLTLQFREKNPRPGTNHRHSHGISRPLIKPNPNGHTNHHSNDRRTNSNILRPIIFSSARSTKPNLRDQMFRSSEQQLIPAKFSLLRRHRLHLSSIRPQTPRTHSRKLKLPPLHHHFCHAKIPPAPVTGIPDVGFITREVIQQVSPYGLVPRSARNYTPRF
jgi:hypothetical protein